MNHPEDFNHRTVTLKDAYSTSEKPWGNHQFIAWLATLGSGCWLHMFFFSISVCQHMVCPSWSVHKVLILFCHNSGYYNISDTSKSIQRLVVWTPPLWKIWVRQLGWLYIPNINGTIQKMATKPPTSIIHWPIFPLFFGAYIPTKEVPWVKVLIHAPTLMTRTRSIFTSAWGSVLALEVGYKAAHDQNEMEKSNTKTEKIMFSGKKYKVMPSTGG